MTRCTDAATLQQSIGGDRAEQVDCEHTPFGVDPPRERHLVGLAGDRRRLSMTQTEFAGLVGVSQAAVSQFEAGSRSPGGRTSAFYDRLEAAVRSDVVTEAIDGRTTTMPAHPWARVIDPDDVGTISLPARLDWSPRVASGWDYADEVHRREIYRIVFDVGDALDIQVFTDPDELLEWSDDLSVARRVQPAFDRLIERLAAVSSRA